MQFSGIKDQNKKIWPKVVKPLGETSKVLEAITSSVTEWSTGGKPGQGLKNRTVPAKPRYSILWQPYNTAEFFR